MKEGDIQPNEEQKQKIASKLQVVAEIAEIKSYLDLYNANKQDRDAIEKDLKKQHAKELAQVRKSTVTKIANMITMHSMI